MIGLDPDGVEIAIELTHFDKNKSLSRTQHWPTFHAGFPEILKTKTLTNLKI